VTEAKLVCHYCCSEYCWFPLPRCWLYILLRVKILLSFCIPSQV